MDKENDHWMLLIIPTGKTECYIFFMYRRYLSYFCLKLDCIGRAEPKYCNIFFPTDTFFLIANLISLFGIVLSLKKKKPQQRHGITFLPQPLPWFRLFSWVGETNTSGSCDWAVCTCPIFCSLLPNLWLYIVACCPPSHLLFSLKSNPLRFFLSFVVFNLCV